MDVKKLCMGCMKEVEQPGVCPYCGYDAGTISSDGHYLMPYTILNGKYLVGKVLGEGGFGITYIGYDLNLEMTVAIKEFYPNGFVTRESRVTSVVSAYQGTNLEAVAKWKNNFIKEARTLARCSHLAGIVGVKDFFEENGTAYIAMEYLEGMTLKDYVKSCGGRMDVNVLLQCLEPVMTALARLHEYGLIHRDISPDNIMLVSGGQMKLLDFGAARDYAEGDEKSLSVMLKPGYAPEEQYRTKGKQGPWSDVYAFAATIYKCITGITPPESMERMRQDEIKRPGELGISINPRTEKAILKGMAVYAENRYQSMTEFMQELFVGAQNAAISAAPQTRTQTSAAEQFQAVPEIQTQTQEQDSINSLGIGTDKQRVWGKHQKIFLAAIGAVVVVIGIIIVKGLNASEASKAAVAVTEDAEETETVEDVEATADLSEEEKAQEAFENAKVKYDEGDYDAALKYFEEARNLDPFNEEIYLLESDCYIQQGEYAAAVSLLDEGVARTNKITLDTKRQYLLESISLVKQEKYCNGIQQEILEYNPDGSKAVQYLYDETGELFEWGKYNYENGIISSEEHYYENGLKKWGIAYYSDGSENVYAAYDRHGQMTEVYIAGYDIAEGSLYSKIYYEPRGLTIDSSMDSVLENGVKWWKIYEYDQNGNQVKETSYNTDGSVSSWQEYYYDEDNNEVGYAAFYEDGTLNVYGESVYDENGNRTSTAEYDSYGNLNWRKEYAYDVLGNLVKELSFYDEGDEAGREDDYVNTYQIEP